VTKQAKENSDSYSGVIKVKDDERQQKGTIWTLWNYSMIIIASNVKQIT